MVAFSLGCASTAFDIGFAFTMFGLGCAFTALFRHIFFSLKKEQ